MNYKSSVRHGAFLHPEVASALSESRSQVLKRLDLDVCAEKIENFTQKNFSGSRKKKLLKASYINQFSLRPFASIYGRRRTFPTTQVERNRPVVYSGSSSNAAIQFKFEKIILQIREDYPYQ